MYITDESNDRIDEFSTAGAFIKTIGWGVSNGKEELQTCTSSCQAGRAGSGNGQFNLPRGLTTDPASGNLYVTEIGGDRVQEITTAGAFVAKFGSAGSGLGRFAQPMGVVVSSSEEIYVTDFENARVQEWGRQTWWPTSAKGSLSKSTTYLYKAVTGNEGTSIEPSEVLSPAPEGVSCGTKTEELNEERHKGCHALSFQYATKTTAKGENEREWGESSGHLSQVMFHAWNPSSKSMEEKAVAEYSYDKQGRLRAEWDPRVGLSTACKESSCHGLKTTYGYDSEGHVTSLTPPGEESWAFTYGTITGDASTGRLLKVMHSPASAALWNGETVKKIKAEAPKLSGTPVVGDKMGVSHGSWSNSPISYGYEWEDCNSEGKSCTPILGATNENYKVASSDVGHTLVAQVTATNGGGSVVATSAASAVASSSGTKTEGPSYSSEPGSTIEYHVPLSGSEGSDLQNLTKEKVEEWGQKDVSEYEDNDPVEGMAIFPPDEPQGWPAADYKRATIDYLNAKGLTVNTASPAGGISTAEYNELNETVRTLSADNRATALKEGCKSVSKKECKSSEVSEKLDIRTEFSPNGSDIVKVLGPEHKIKLASGVETEARAITHDYYDEGAEEAEATNREGYNLVTKSTTGALLATGEEKDVRTTITSYNGQNDLGWKLRKPTSTTIDPKELDLTSTTTYNENTGQVVERQTSGANAEAASSQKSFFSFGGSGSGSGQLSGPAGVAVDSSGDVWVVDTGHNRVQEFNSKGEFVREFGGSGSGNGVFSKPEGIAVSSSGNVYVADTGNYRVQEFNSKGEFVRVIGSLGEGNGQFGDVRGVAVDGEGHVWTVEYGLLKTRVQEFTSEGVYINQFGKEGTGNVQFKSPKGIAVDSKGNVWVADTGNNRVQELKPNGEFVRVFGSEGTSNGLFKKPSSLAFDPEGDLWVADTGNNRVQRFTSEGSYLSQFGTVGNENGQFAEPEGIATDSSGNVWVADTGNNRIDTWTPEHRFAHDTKAMSYSAKEESPVAACRNHPEWAGLTCQTEPAAQPDRGLPELPVSVVASYNIWGEAEKTEEKFGIGAKAVTRTKTETYDPAGRAVTSEETASPVTDTALPKVTNEYNSATGALENQSTSTSAITSKYNTLGQLTEYKDASGNVTKYVYEEGGDGRLLEVSEGKGEEAKSTTTYTYNTTTGFMEKLIDTAAGMSTAQGTFTASYDVEGKMTSEVYPNGMCANTTYNSVGEATSLEYIKTRNCSETGAPVWFSDNVLSSIHGETLLQTSTLSKEEYEYDDAGRLLKTQETPAGKGCVVRLYAYEEESNRTSETSREPGTEGKCATAGGTVEHHTYDEANRLTDTGIEYETFGNTTKMPAADAGGHEITSTYYLDNQLATETQNSETFKYLYDPSGRTMETTAEGKTSSKVISHYAGSGNALTWTSEGSEKWTRNIPGIDGALDAVQTGGGSIVLQLHDLQGNIVGTAGDNESETKMLTPYNSTEFGVPQPGTTPPKYAWLGASGVSTEISLGSGVATEGGASYVPQVASGLQTAPIVPPGAFPNGSSGTQFTAAPVTAGAIAGAQEIATQFWQKAETERQKAREEEAVAALQQCQAEGGCGAEEGVPVSTHLKRRVRKLVKAESIRACS